MNVPRMWFASCFWYAIHLESGAHEMSKLAPSKRSVSIFSGVGWSMSMSHRLRRLSAMTTFLLSGDQRGA